MSRSRATTQMTKPPPAKHFGTRYKSIGEHSSGLSGARRCSGPSSLGRPRGCNAALGPSEFGVSKSGRPATTPHRPASTFGDGTLYEEFLWVHGCVLAKLAESPRAPANLPRRARVRNSVRGDGNVCRTRDWVNQCLKVTGIDEIPVRPSQSVPSHSERAKLPAGVYKANAALRRSTPKHADIQKDTR